jgi:hypothetical protein
MQDSNVSQTTVAEVVPGNETTQPVSTQEQESGKKLSGLERLIEEAKNIQTGQTKSQVESEVENKEPEPKPEEVPPPAETIDEQKTDDKSPMDGGEPNVPFKKWEEMSQPEVIEKAKKFQSAADKAKAELAKLQKGLAERDNILQTIYKDPISAFKQIAPELLDVLDLQQPIPATLQRWQESVLKPELKQMFPNLVDDDWKPDSNEVFEPGSPTNYFFTHSEDKRKELEQRQNMSVQQRQQSEQTNHEMEQVVVERNLEDKKYVMETFGFTDEQMMAYAKRFDEMTAKVDPNDPYPATHPFRVQNLMKAAFFDELSDIKVQKAVNEAVNKLHQEYKMKGMTLPQKPMPVDVTKINTQSIQTTQPAIRPNNGTIMNRIINQATTINRG